MLSDPDPDREIDHGSVSGRVRDHALVEGVQSRAARHGLGVATAHRSRHQRVALVRPEIEGGQ